LFVWPLAPSSCFGGDEILVKRKVAQYRLSVGAAEYASVGDCFETTWLTEGPKSEAFLAALRDLMKVKHACFAPNGTLALYLALRAAGVGVGDEVIVPDFTFFGSAAAVEMTGAIPVFCDIDPNTLQATAGHIDRHITSKTRAIMPVHIYGAACEMDAIVELARSRSLLIVEDAAQAVGVSYRGRHAGTFGELGCFSFFADKTITTGEGGLIVTNDDAIYNTLLYRRNQGRIDRGSFIHPEIGYNFRITDMQAAVGLVQLSRLEEIARSKREILGRYRMGLARIPEIRIIDPPEGSTHIPFRAAVYAQRLPALMKFMTAEGIEARTFFYPLHLQPGLAYLRPRHPSANEVFPGAIYAYENGVCLPLYPGMPTEDVEYVCDKIGEFYRK
jgi:perosamine synthetase